MSRRPLLHRRLPNLSAVLLVAGFAAALAAPWITGPGSARMFGTACILWAAAAVAFIVDQGRDAD